MQEYKKGLKLTTEELKSLNNAIEMAINNAMLGCNPKRFEILKGIEKRLKDCKK